MVTVYSREKTLQAKIPPKVTHFFNKNHYLRAIN